MPAVTMNHHRTGDGLPFHDSRIACDRQRKALIHSDTVIVKIFLERISPVDNGARIGQAHYAGNEQCSFIHRDMREHEPDHYIGLVS